MAKRHRWAPGRSGYIGAVLSKGTAIITVRCTRCGAVKRHVHDQRGYHAEYGTDPDQKEWDRRCPPCPENPDVSSSTT